MVKLNVNGKMAEMNVDPDTPLLWAVREQLGLTGTKFGCGASLCGACTVHVDGQAVRSCQTLVGDAEGLSVTTIEGLKADDGTLHAVQQAWIEHQVPQCGYCQSGQGFITAGTLAGGALLVAVAIRPGHIEKKMAKYVEGEGESLVTAFVKIGQDNKITAIIPHSEIVARHSQRRVPRGNQSDRPANYRRLCLCAFYGGERYSDRRRRRARALDESRGESLGRAAL